MGETAADLPAALGVERDGPRRPARRSRASSTATSTSPAAAGEAGSRAACRRCRSAASPAAGPRPSSASSARTTWIRGTAGLVARGAGAHRRGPQRLLPDRRLPPAAHDAHGERPGRHPPRRPHPRRRRGGHQRPPLQPADARRAAALAAEAHVAGLLAAKAGLVHLHLGGGARGLELVRRALAESELPPRTFHPTHVNRSAALFEEALDLARARDGAIDVHGVPRRRGRRTSSRVAEALPALPRGRPAARGPHGQLGRRRQPPLLRRRGARSSAWASATPRPSGPRWRSCSQAGVAPGASPARRSRATWPASTVCRRRAGSRRRRRTPTCVVLDEGRRVTGT